MVYICVLWSPYFWILLLGYLLDPSVIAFTSFGGKYTVDMRIPFFQFLKSVMECLRCFRPLEIHIWVVMTLIK